MRDFMTVVRALGDESRVRALLALRGRELCLCQIIMFLGLAPSTVSKHMSILKYARLVDTRKSGRWVFYRLAGSDASPEAQGAIEWLRESLANSRTTLKDDERLLRVLELDPSEACKLVQQETRKLVCGSAALATHSR